ncbi:MAG: hypothetical protein HY392_02240 [Candidatus Diapherotrites archaeon]|nr:hypothetical protein [Candidatus Diapherotrites archaeon]
MEEISPRILVGSPVTSLKKYCLADYLKGLKSLTYENKEFFVVDDSPNDQSVSEAFKAEGISCMRVPFNENIAQMLADSRNVLRQKALDDDFDFFLQIEQDVIPPADVIEHLLSNGKKIVSAAFFNFSHQQDTSMILPNHFSLINPADKHTSITRRLAFEDLWPSRLIKIFLTGIGCILIHKSVLKEIKFRVDPNLNAYDDVHFCRDANEKRFEIFLDSRVMCLHLNRPWSE